VDDHVMIPKFGLRKDLDGLATKEFGSYITLNTLTIHDKCTSMPAPQFAKLLEIAPIYELKGEICYWFALLIFLVVRKRTGSTENGGDKIERRGKLLNYKLGGASASDDDEGCVPNHEYERALKDLQKFVDKMNDPDEAQGENRQTRKRQRAGREGSGGVEEERGECEEAG